MKKNNFGFTLIEVLAVVLIIGILTAIGLPQYRRSVQRTEAMEALVNLKSIFESAKRYRSANSQAPLNLKGLDVQFFDADPNASEPVIGNYKYMFNSDRISACRVNGKGAASYDNTYCFIMYYSYKRNSINYRDLLVCNSSSQKWQKVCEALAQTCKNTGEAAQSEHTYYISDKVVCD